MMQRMNADLALAYQNYYANAPLMEEIHILPTMNEIPFPNILGDTNTLRALGLEVRGTDVRTPKHPEDALVVYEVTYKGWRGVVERRLDPDTSEGVLLTKTFSDGLQTLTDQVDLTHGVLPYSRWDRLKGQMDGVDLLEGSIQSFKQMMEDVATQVEVEDAPLHSSMSHRMEWKATLLRGLSQDWRISLAEDQKGVICISIKNESTYSPYEEFYGDGNSVQHLSLHEASAAKVLDVVQAHPE